MADPQPFRIGLIHALADSVAPCHAAFARHWPEAFAFDLLDTSLSLDRAEPGSSDDDVTRRIRDLYDYVRSAAGCAGGTDAILFTCSAFGPAIGKVQQDAAIPVLRPNESAFREAMTLGRSIGLVTTFAPSTAALAAELAQMGEEAGAPLTIRSAYADGALAALQQGRPEEHDRLIAEAGLALRDVDVIVVGQFSAARAAPRLTALTSIPVLATPDAAVRDLKQRLTAPRAFWSGMTFA